MLKEKELLGFFLTGHPMEEFQPILKRLSCVPLSEVAHMAHDSVFRSALLVESVQIKLSSKTQKKFAILVISDGIDRFELPIWPELYEEKGMLLHENQLLYAVLQVDKKTESLRLSCRWLDDLNRADDTMIEACDRAYDRAKQMAGRVFKPKVPQMGINANGVSHKAVMSEDNKKENQTIQLMRITLDADAVRLSHILKLKECFSKHRGATPIQLEFHTPVCRLATLHIEARWGISVSDQLQQLLRQFPVVKEVKIE